MNAKRPEIPKGGPKGETSAEVAAFLEQVKRLPAKAAGGRRGRLMFALDATMSRQPTWDRACHIQAEMFTTTESIGGLEVQLVWFRGHGEFRASRWHTRPRELAAAMTAVRCRAGFTQIGRVLRHAIAESRRAPIQALVYVGDCVEEDFDHLAGLAGELGLLGVKAFIFHEGGEPHARQVFAEIARLTGGAWVPFDSASPDQLRQLLGAVAVYAAGGYAALEDYSRRQGGSTMRLIRQIKSQ